MKKIISDPFVVNIIIFVTVLSVTQFLISLPIWQFFERLTSGLSLPAVLPKSNEYLIQSMGFFSSFIGIFVSFVVVKTWEDFTSLEKLITKEQVSLESLYRALLSFDSRKTRKFQTKSLYLVAQYIDEIRRSVFQEGENNFEKVLNEIKDSFLLLKKRKLSETEVNIILPEVLSQLNETIIAKREREIIAKQNVYKTYRILLIASVIGWLVISSLILPPHASIAEIFSSFGQIFLVLMILAVLEDISEPFSGYWKISLNKWNNLYSEIINSQVKPDVANKKSSKSSLNQETF